MLDFGTLWIKSLGVGLVLSHGRVSSIALRRFDDIPTSNCGPLLESHLQLSLSADLDAQIQDARSKQHGKRTHDSKKTLAISVMLLATIALVAGLYFRVQSVSQSQAMWLAAPSIDATVVATRPAGEPFPDSYTLEYTVPGDPPRRFDADWQSVRYNLKEDKTLEIRYLEQAPDRAMTMTQIFENNVINQVPTILIAVMVYFFGMIFLGILCR